MFVVVPALPVIFPVTLPVKLPVTFPVSGPVKLPAVTAPVTAKEPSVPTEVNDEFTTPAFNVLPVSVPAAAVTTIADAPSKFTPFIVFPGVSLVAVAALPVIFPVTLPVKLPVTFPVSGPVKLPAVTAPVTAKEPSVPTEVNDEFTTPAFNVLPVSVPAAAVTTIADAPSKFTPFIVFPGVSLVAVAALPVISPVTLPVTFPVKLPVTLPVSGPVKLPAVTAPVTASDPSVPTEVNDEFTTPAFNVLPVSVPAAAATIIGDAPSKFTPFIVFPGVSLVAVAALPEVLAVLFGISALTRDGN